MEKRTLLALALSFLVIGLYPLVMQKLYPDYSKGAFSPLEPKPQDASSKDTLPAQKPLLRNPLTSAAIFLPEEDFIFTQGGLRLILNRKDAGIREASFLDYPDSETKSPLRFFSLAAALGAPTSLRIAGAEDPILYDVMALDADSLAAEASWDGFKIAKHYRFHPSGYSARFSVAFENVSGEARELSYQLFAGVRIPPRHSIDEQYLEANFFSHPNGKPEVRHIKETKAGKSVESAGPVEWAAVKDRHFSVIVKPLLGTSFTGLVEGLGNHQFRTALVSEKVTVPAGGSVEQDFLLYIGPNDLEHLAPLGLDPLVNFGKLDAIGKLLVGGLELLHKIFKNYGVSIIVLTLLINVALHSLLRRKAVVYFTHEISGHETDLRFTARVSDIPIVRIVKDSDCLELALRRRVRFWQLHRPRLIIREYPTKTASPESLRNCLYALEGDSEFRPDLMVVDYADIMRSTRYQGNGEQERFIQADVYEQLRALAQEFDCPLVTASQCNRASVSKSLIHMEDIAESYAKCAIADHIIAICQTPREEAKGELRLFYAGSRSGRTGRAVRCRRDWARFYVSEIGLAPAATLSGKEEE